MGLFHKQTEEEKFIAREMKLLEAKEKRTLKFAEYAGTLALSKDAFERAIDLERLNALKKRKAGLSDVTERSRIHDACVSLLGIEEAEFELASARSVQDLKQAEQSLQKLLKKLYRISAPGALSAKEYRQNIGAAMEDGEEPASFSERAEMVDERFVEWIIEGLTMKECVKRCTHTRTPDYGVAGIDFTKAADSVDDISFIKADADQH